MAKADCWGAPYKMLCSRRN